MSCDRGKLISLEGIDGSGKTTQATLLCKFLESSSFSVKSYHFPDTSLETGKILKSTISKGVDLPHPALFALFSVNRLERKHSIETSCRAGDIIVLDRYCESEYAYGLAHGLPYDWLLCLESQMPPADLVIILDVDAKGAARRKKSRISCDTFETRLDLQERVRLNYLSLSADPPIAGQRWEVVDASQEIRPVHLTIVDFVSELLGEG